MIPLAEENTWKLQLEECRALIPQLPTTLISGRVVKVTGLVMEAVGINLPVGSA